MPNLLQQLPLSPTTRLAYQQMPAPPRAWALAKAAFETAHEANFAEQRAAAAQATTDDPEPPFYDQLAESATHQEVDEVCAKWQAWHDRNDARITAATQSIRDRYPHNLEKLAQAAERNLVDWAEECLRAKFPSRGASVQPVFDAYRAGNLYGDQLQSFLKICFNCPSN